MGDDKLSISMRRQLQVETAKQTMALAMIKAGCPNKYIIEQTGLTSMALNVVYERYKKGNFDALTKEVIGQWESLIKAKMMEASEIALDKILEYLVEGHMGNVKSAASAFNTLFSNFRLATGQSTENVSSAVTRFNEIIDNKRKLKKPNQSAEEEKEINVTPV